MRFKLDAVAVCAVLLCGIIIVGEYLTYSSDAHDLWADAEWGEGYVDYSIHSSGSDPYSSVLIDNSGRVPVSELTILVDDGYLDNFQYAMSDGSALFIDQDYYESQIKGALRIRGFTAVQDCTSSSLHDYLESTSDSATGRGLLVMTYALPMDVYDGTSDCLLLRWMSNGGTLYWVGSEIGSYYLDGKKLIRVDNNQKLFLGSDCINVDGPDVAGSMVDNGFCSSLLFKGPGIRFSADPSAIGDALGMGYVESGYCTIVFASYGKGQTCIFGGPSDINQIEDIGQVIASGITCCSTIVGCSSGVVTRSTIESSFDILTDSSVLYIYLGGYYVNYGCRFHE